MFLCILSADMLMNHSDPTQTLLPTGADNMSVHFFTVLLLVATVILLV